MGSSAEARHEDVPGDDDLGSVEVTVTTDTSMAPHKAGEAKLYVMRNSKDPDGPALYFTEAEWEAFVLGVKDGEFDLDEHGNLPELGGPGGSPEGGRAGGAR
ncbi:MAG TPA: DUF397 domain-containing protein [Streptosporangiaceae bacterium]|nr:DUF397 domain-containing protein [Streptosporangiaceae bacterium]